MFMSKGWISAGRGEVPEILDPGFFMLEILTARIGRMHSGLEFDEISQSGGLLFADCLPSGCWQ